MAVDPGGKALLVVALHRGELLHEGRVVREGQQLLQLHEVGAPALADGLVHELGEGRVPAGWDGGLTDGRMIVVETTREKLEEFLPAIRNLAEGECYGSQESAWNWSAYIFLRIYWQGAVDNLKTGDFAVN